MGTVRALDVPLAVNDRAPAVAVVACDGVVGRRTTTALAQDGQVVLIQAASFDELEPEDARRADAVVIACRARADQRATAIRARQLEHGLWQSPGMS